MSTEKPELAGRPPRIDDGITGSAGMKHAHDDMFFAAMQTTRMPMLVTDPHQPDNPIVFANRAFIQMSGYAEAELLGRNCRFLQGDGTDRESVQAIREAVAARRDVTVEILNYRKDGTSFWNALYISPVFNKTGDLVYFFASQLDVSRRRDAEQALHQTQKMEALGQLTGGIAHDFNNLLQVMGGHIDLLTVRARADKLAPADALVSAEKLRAAVDKAATLTSQLLSFSRRQQLQGRVVNINQVVASLAVLLERTLGPDIRVMRDLADDLDNCRLDSTQFELALLNIVVNARDAMPAGGSVSLRTANVVIQADDGEVAGALKPGRYAVVTVSDSGAGIPAPLLPRVIDPFFTTKDEGKGTGLGLSMAFGFAKQSGGALTLYSEEGVGTTVRMYFPSVAEAPTADRAETLARYRGGSEHVLVVDDRLEVADTTAQMLESLGYRVTVAHSGTQALTLIEQTPAAERPALLFSDVIMPGGMNGYVLARKLQSQLPSLRILLTTGYAGELGGRFEAGSSDEFEVIRKPFVLKELAQRVRRVLDGAAGSDA